MNTLIKVKTKQSPTGEYMLVKFGKVKMRVEYCPGLEPYENHRYAASCALEESSIDGSIIGYGWLKPGISVHMVGG